MSVVSRRRIPAPRATRGEPRGCIAAFRNAALSHDADGRTSSRCSDSPPRLPCWQPPAVEAADMSSLQKRAEAAADPETVVASPAGLTHPEIRFVFYGLMLGGFLQALNQTIVASALPTIGRDLNDFHNLSWVVIAYLLSSTIVAPLYGKLA